MRNGTCWGDGRSGVGVRDQEATVFLKQILCLQGVRTGEVVPVHRVWANKEQAEFKCANKVNTQPPQAVNRCCVQSGLARCSLSRRVHYGLAVVALLGM